MQRDEATPRLPDEDQLQDEVWEDESPAPVPEEASSVSAEPEP